MPGNATCKLLFLFFVLLATNAFADLAVSIQPADGNTLFYPNEVREYQVLVINTGNQAEIGTRFELNTSESLVLLEENKETDKIQFTLPEIKNRDQVTVPIRVKARDLPSDRAIISVNYGQTQFTGLSAVQHVVRQPGFQTHTSIQSTTIALNENNKIEVTARNDSNNPVANIVIRPALEPALQPLSPHVYTLDQLDENEAIPPQTFEFVPKGNVLGKFNAGVIIEFDDEQGHHVIDRRYIVSVEDRSISLLLALLLIGALAYIFFASKEKSKPASEPRKTKKK